MPPAAFESATSAAAPRRRNRRGEGDRLRADLIASASQLLETVPGEEALSLRAVARTAGVAAPSIYPHFPDKHELVRAVLAERFAELRDVLNEAGRQAGSPDRELRSRCTAYVQFAQEQPGNYRVMFTAVPSTVGPRELAELPGAEIVQELQASIARCRDVGIGGPLPDPATACLLWSALHGIVTLRVSKPAFPWPPVPLMIDQTLHALCGLPLPAQG
ncbi:MAG: TetR/AcrR family transcriptional regulator [Austwickia sp.]|jgi:AcrR family transcriptional regulator|nr:MAG: TetR/AcrR family transcriptional regulator [Austwickia sp.]